MLLKTNLFHGFPTVFLGAVSGRACLLWWFPIRWRCTESLVQADMSWERCSHFPPADSAPFSCLVLCRSHLLSSVTSHAWKSVYCVVNLIRNSLACMCITHPDMDTCPGVNSIVKADIIEWQMMMAAMALSSAAIKTSLSQRAHELNPWSDHRQTERVCVE